MKRRQSQYKNCHFVIICNLIKLMATYFTSMRLYEISTNMQLVAETAFKSSVTEIHKLESFILREFSC